MTEIAEEIFSYNREGWTFLSELRQRDLYQRQKMRMSQVELYRQDLRDLFSLSVSKMDRYLIVCVVMLSISMEMYYKGKSPPSAPSWFFWCWAITLSTGMVSFLFTLWCALQASVSAQTYLTRASTQWLRPPIPGVKEIQYGSARLEDFERTEAGRILRVPLTGSPDKAKKADSGYQHASRQRESSQKPSRAEAGSMHGDLGHSPNDLASSWQGFFEHLELFNAVHERYKLYEAYARVGMSFGMDQLLTGFGYFCIIYYAIEFDAPLAGWAFLTLFQSAALVFALSNLMVLKRAERAFASFLICAPAGFVAVAVAVAVSNVPGHGMYAIRLQKVPQVLSILCMITHAAWVLFFARQVMPDKTTNYPRNFSATWCINLLGLGIEALKEVSEPSGKIADFRKSTSSEAMPESAAGPVCNSFALEFRVPTDPQSIQVLFETAVTLRDFLHSEISALVSSSTSSISLASLDELSLRMQQNDSSLLEAWKAYSGSEDGLTGRLELQGNRHGTSSAVIRTGFDPQENVLKGVTPRDISGLQTVLDSYTCLIGLVGASSRNDSTRAKDPEVLNFKPSTGNLPWAIFRFLLMLNLILWVFSILDTITLLGGIRTGSNSASYASS